MEAFSPRVCPKCTYEDDDPDTLQAPRCPNCNSLIQEELEEERNRQRLKEEEKKREEEEAKQWREEEAEWRERRSDTEARNRKSFDPSFLEEAKQKRRLSIESAQLREHGRRHPHDQQSSVQQAGRPKDPQDFSAVQLSSNANQLSSVSEKPHLTVFIMGMPGASVGKTSVGLRIEEALQHLHLLERVTIFDDKTLSELKKWRKTGNHQVLVLGVYDVCNSKSFDYCVEAFFRHDVVFTTVLVGNKADMEYWRQVSVERAVEATRAKNITKYFEVSAMTGLHIGYLMDMILAMVLSDQESNDILAQKGLMRETSKIYDECEEEDETSGSSDSSSSQSSSDSNRDIGGLIGLQLIDKRKSGIRTRAKKMKYKKNINVPAASLESKSVVYPPLSQPSPPVLPFPQPVSPPQKREEELRDVEEYGGTIPESLNLDPTSPSASNAFGKEDRLASSSNLLNRGMVEDEFDNDQAFQKTDELEEEDAMELYSEGSEEGESIDEENEPLNSALLEIQRQIDMQKDIIDESILSCVERSEYMMERADNLMDDPQYFKAEVKRLKKHLMIRNICCCCCIAVGECCECSSNVLAAASRACMSCSSKCIAITSNQWKRVKFCVANLLPRKSLMDNVLADTENAFQTLAKTIDLLIGKHDFDKTWAFYNYTFGVWQLILCSLISYGLVFVFTLVLILPSFFTLLVVRTSTIEKESKSFGIRQEKIRHEDKYQAAKRWLRIVLRSLPMSMYLLVVPYFLVFHVFPVSRNSAIELYLLLYLSGIIILQMLGSLRVYYSWKTKDTTVPAAPDMYYRESNNNASRVGTATMFGACCKSSAESRSFEELHIEKGTAEDEEHLEKKKTPVPVPPNTFTASASNVIVLLSLLLEYFQMASFPLQNNPIDEPASDDMKGATMSPTMAPTSDEGSPFWGEEMFNSVYMKLTINSDITVVLMWAALGVVALLLVVFATKFFFELKQYGRLLRRVEDKDLAKDTFFFGFTGAIVYGHGKPNNISKRMRLVVSVLSDALFLVLSLQLLSVLACDYDNNNDEATLRAKDSIVCWEGDHAILATLSLIAYAYYVPLSIMITPMLLEVPSSESKEKPKDGGVAFLKLYLMTVNVVKSVMMVVAVLGPQSLLALSIITCVSSLLLGALTVAWYSSQDHNSMAFSASIHPCNISFINYWKATSYTTSVVSALVVFVFYQIRNASFATVSNFTGTIIACWAFVLLCFGASYWRQSYRLKDRRKLIEDLIVYPFLWRDRVEASANDPRNKWNCWWCDNDNDSERRIPGFSISPWHDYYGCSAGIVEEHFSVELLRKMQ